MQNFDFNFGKVVSETGEGVTLNQRGWSLEFPLLQARLRPSLLLKYNSCWSCR